MINWLVRNVEVLSLNFPEKTEASHKESQPRYLVPRRDLNPAHPGHKSCELVRRAGSVISSLLIAYARSRSVHEIKEHRGDVKSQIRHPETVLQYEARLSTRAPLHVNINKICYPTSKRITLHARLLTIQELNDKDQPRKNTVERNSPRDNEIRKVFGR